MVNKPVIEVDNGKLSERKITIPKCFFKNFTPLIHLLLYGPDCNVTLVGLRHRRHSFPFCRCQSAFRSVQQFGYAVSMPIDRGRSG